MSRWWAVAGLALFAATWKLWTPQNEFPQVPMFLWAGRWPFALDWLCVSIVAVALLMAFTSSRLERPAWCVCGLALSILFLLDQHRWQPWAYQLLLMSCVFGARQDGPSDAFRNAALGWLRLLTVSIYFWSAVSKFDSRFFATHGQTLIAALWQSFGLNPPEWSRSWLLAAMLPAGELLIAAGLSWPRFRRIAVWFAMGLHVALLFALGPLGLQQRPGVLIWNVAFIGHVWWLFPPVMASGQLVGVLPGRPQVGRSWRWNSILAFAIFWPITEPWGLCGRWLAWGVYSARGERISVMLTNVGEQRLPECARRVMIGGELPLDQWSLAAVDAPIYPQLRFQCAVVEWLRQHCGDDNVIEVNLQTARTTAKMPWHTERLTLDEWRSRSNAFWLNTQPR